MRIAFVVSGGDAPGINTALYHFAVQIHRFGEQLLGVQGGFPGLLEENYRHLGMKDLLPWAAMPGSILASSRVPVLAQEDAREKLADVIKNNAIDALVVFGGDLVKRLLCHARRHPGFTHPHGYPLDRRAMLRRQEAPRQLVGLFAVRRARQLTAPRLGARPATIRLQRHVHATPPSARGSPAPSSVPSPCRTIAPAWPIRSE